jgi:curved DNA-binding protein CbpA
VVPAAQPAAAARSPSASAAASSAAAPPRDDAAKRKETEARRQEILEAYEGLKTRNHFETLGIPKASNESQVKEAYFRLARRFHPDVHHDPALADMRDKLEAVFIRLGEAYEVLRNARSRGSYESDLAARMPRSVPQPSPGAPPPAPQPEVEAQLAAESIRRAEKALLEEKYWDAIQLLEKAIPNVEGKQKQRARIALSKAYVKNPKWVKRAEDVLQTVVQEDPSNVAAYFSLGEIYRNGGLRSRATSMFRKVLELKPDHEEALAAMASLAPENPQPPPEGGGLLKKLFGKT